jgi:hypothetical protein
MYFHVVSPRSLPVSFVDNLEVLCDKIPDLLASSSALKFFCSLLDLELDLSCFYGLLPLPGDVSLIMDV